MPPLGGGLYYRTILIYLVRVGDRGLFVIKCSFV